MNKLVMYAVLVGVVINLVLPQVLLPLATPDEVKPPNGAENLNLKEQLMHMFVHHAQVPFSSSVIIAVIVSLSVILGGMLKKRM
tara:strand:+ start:861 stop:1112 length:252 start_codon:yes stop_codon:yes gene_type:complete